MKSSLLKKLVCPDCKIGFTLKIFEHKKQDIKDGILICPRCNHFYLIVNFIPRILPSNLYFSREFIEKYKRQINSLHINIEKTYMFDKKQNSLNRLKRNTIRSFGFEWLEYARFGWDDPNYNIKKEENVFREKSLLYPEEIQGKLVLDAGCGNGRYSNWSAQYGAEVIGIDLGDGVESAYKNLKDLENVHIIQGDIFHLPFKKEIFDVIFSIGVLMHTGNTKLATKSLVEHLKKSGSITVHIYHRGNPVYEFNDFIIRKITTKLSIKNMVNFTNKMFKLSRVLEKLHLLPLINLFIRLETHPHCIFDWYSAPIAAHHTYREVYKWFDEFGLKVVKTKEESRPTLRKYIHSRIIKAVNKFIPPKALTIRGIKI